MAANVGHIWMPLSEEARLAGFYQDYEKTKVPWKRPWKFGEEERLPGKRMTIQNKSFVDAKGQVKTWDPLYVACHYLKRAQDAGCDVIHVKTEKYRNEPGNQALADCQIKVSALQNMPNLMPQFFQKVKNGELRLEEESVNEMPSRWKATDAGVFYPEG